jgi:dUTPase
MRFAQMVVCQVSKGSFYKVDSVEGIGEDRGGGFGSTGLMGI